MTASTANRPFLAQLRAALVARELTAEQLAEQAGIGKSAVYRAATGTSLPTLDNAQRMAEVLMWAPLVDAVVAARTRTCVVCGASFVDNSRNKRGRTCRTECQRTDYQRRKTGRTQLRAYGRAEVAENRLGLYQGAVDRMCRTCEPEGLCGDSGCPLRTVSPLPLSRRNAA